MIFLIFFLTLVSLFSLMVYLIRFNANRDGTTINIEGRKELFRKTLLIIASQTLAGDFLKVLGFLGLIFL